GARLRDEHDRVRGAGRRPLRDRLPESRARFRARPDHAALLRSRPRQDGEPGHRSRARRQAVAVVAAVGADDRTDGRIPEPGVSVRRLEVGGWRLAGWKLETGSRKLEAGNWEL